MSCVADLQGEEVQGPPQGGCRGRRRVTEWARHVHPVGQTLFVRRPRVSGSSFGGGRRAAAVLCLGEGCSAALNVGENCSGNSSAGRSGESKNWPEQMWCCRLLLPLNRGPAGPRPGGPSQLAASQWTAIVDPRRSPRPPT
jgi:hypothetical protein